MVHQNVLHWVKMVGLLYPSFKQSLDVDQPKKEVPLAQCSLQWTQTLKEQRGW